MRFLTNSMCICKMPVCLDSRHWGEKAFYCAGSLSCSWAWRRELHGGPRLAALDSRLSPGPTFWPQPMLSGFGLLSSQKLLLFLSPPRPTSVRPVSRGSISCWFLLVLWSAAASAVFPSLWAPASVVSDSADRGLLGRYHTAESPSMLLSGLN